MAATVKFYRGSYDNYIVGLNDGRYLDGLFFDTTNHCIYLNGLKYGASEDPATDASKEWVDNKYGEAFVGVTQVIDETGFVASFICALDGSSAESINIPIASFIEAGLMSKEDKIKLEEIEWDTVVIKEEGKGLSTNDYTNEDKKKLEGIAEGAEVNTIQTIKLNGVTQNIDIDRIVDLDINTIIDDRVKNEISSSYQYKGSVNNASELPTEGQELGDIYNIVNESDYGPAGMNVAWDGKKWDALGGIFNTSAIDNKINAIESDISDLDIRIDTLESYDLHNRISKTEEAIEIFNGDSDVEGSIISKATEVAINVVNEQFAWEEV